MCFTERRRLRKGGKGRLLGVRQLVGALVLSTKAVTSHRTPRRRLLLGLERLLATLAIHDFDKISFVAIGEQLNTAWR